MEGEVNTLAGREALPEPPNLAWGWLVLLQFVTFGFFPLGYAFVQARWIKRIDPESRASQWLGIALACWAVYFVVISVPTYLAMFYPSGFGRPSGMGFIQFILIVGALVFALLAWFGMADSMRRALPAHGLVPEISGVYVFFFNVFYLQGQLQWIHRWRDTGELEPRPPQAVMWWLLPLWFVVSAVTQFALVLVSRSIRSY
jgi:glucan phosphoethanolaminetransferase (alkaline phosphatase superfamily)